MKSTVWASWEMSRSQPHQHTCSSKHLFHSVSFKLLWSMPWISFVWLNNSRTEMVTGGMCLCKYYFCQFSFFPTSEQTCIFHHLTGDDELSQSRLWLGSFLKECSLEKFLEEKWTIYTINEFVSFPSKPQAPPGKLGREWIDPLWC